MNLALLSFLKRHHGQLIQVLDYYVILGKGKSSYMLCQRYDGTI